MARTLLAAERPPRFYVDYSQTPDVMVARAFDAAILSPEARFDMARLRISGRTAAYGYLSVVEIAPDAYYRTDPALRDIPVVGRNEEWKSDLMDITHPAWKVFVITNLAAKVAERGFDGFFLDTVDSVELLAQRSPARAEEFRAALAELVREIKKRHPTCKIILNRGFNVWERLKDTVDGVLVESVFQTFDPGTKAYRAVPARDTDYLLGVLAKIKAAGLQGYVLDYVDPTKLELAEATARKIEAAGYGAFVSTPELRGVCLAPVREVPRRLLVLYGNQEESLQFSIRWPVDTTIASMVQMPLEWLGYELEYLNPGETALPDPLPPRFAGVLVDKLLAVGADEEARMTAWLVRQKQSGQKIVFVGELPFREQENLDLIVKEFGFGGTGKWVRGVTNVVPVVISPHMNYEGKVAFLAAKVRDLTAPAGSEVWLGVQAQGNSNPEIRSPKADEEKSKRFDAVSITPWGGVLLAPYDFFRRPDLTEIWLVDPFEFFSKALRRPNWPVPDRTTREGLRIFYSHIDGDGFRHRSSVALGKRSGEIILERVIEKYPFPFTCSVIEAELRGWVVDQKEGDEAVLGALAKRMFALPKVEAASHTFSHPFFWQEDDKTTILYDRANLNLKTNAGGGRVVLEREIRDSVKYIEAHLLPPGKQVKVFLWSGNCRPPPEALHQVRQLGMENMNGGDTIISARNPTLTKVASFTLPWGDELQIHTGLQNESVYWERWQPDARFNAPFHGGFIHALDGFKRLESPRRLKPVNIYFHYYSGDNLAALKALTGLFDWALTQELHAMTVSEYARVVRDAWQTRLFRTTGDTWLAVNDGTARTLRFDGENRFPDYAACSGVTGARTHAGVTYVHTAGSPRIELKWTDKPPGHLHLISSTAAIAFEELSATRAHFTSNDVRPGTVKLGGLRPGQGADVQVNGLPAIGLADDRGVLSMNLPERAEVKVEAR